MNDLTQKLAEYNALIIEEKKIEKVLEEFFLTMAIRDNPRYDRCADYGERVIQIVIPFDEINLNIFSVEKIEEARKRITEYREMRKKQKILENEIHQHEVIDKQIKADVHGFGDY